MEGKESQQEEKDLGESVSDFCLDATLREGIVKPGDVAVCVGMGQDAQTLGSLAFSPCCLWALSQEDKNQATWSEVTVPFECCRI